MTSAQAVPVTPEQVRDYMIDAVYFDEDIDSGIFAWHMSFNEGMFEWLDRTQGPDARTEALAARCGCL